MPAFVTFHGTQAEAVALVNAVANACECERAMLGIVSRVCGAHRILTEDQRALNGLLFARRIRARLIAEEQTETSAAVRAMAVQP